MLFLLLLFLLLFCFLLQLEFSLLLSSELAGRCGRFGLNWLLGVRILFNWRSGRWSLLLKRQSKVLIEPRKVLPRLNDLSICNVIPFRL
jgi:hypothetical protein